MHVLKKLPTTHVSTYRRYTVRFYFKEGSTVDKRDCGLWTGIGDDCYPSRVLCAVTAERGREIEEEDVRRFEIGNRLND